MSLLCRADFDLKLLIYIRARSKFLTCENDMVSSKILNTKTQKGDKEMPKHCEICNKQALKANKISFSNKHYTYKQQPNLQTVKTEINGTVKRIKVCASCIKANKVKKVV